MIDGKDIVPNYGSIFTSAFGVRFSKSIDCYISAEFHNFVKNGTGDDTTFGNLGNFDTDGCTLDVINIINCPTSDIFRFAGSRADNKITILHSETVFFDTKICLVDEADDVTNTIHQNTLETVGLLATGVEYDYKRFYGTVGDTGGNNSERITTQAATTDWSFILDAITQIGVKAGVRFAPGVDNTLTLGASSNRWTEVFAVNNVINTSDERYKTFGDPFTVKQKAVAVRLKALLSNFKWNESIEREENGGNKARIHIGIGAQSLGQAFTDEGLNPNDYAMFCYDEWPEEKVGDEVVTEAGNRYGVRLEQVNAFIIANT